MNYIIHIIGMKYTSGLGNLKGISRADTFKILLTHYISLFRALLSLSMGFMSQSYLPKLCLLEWVS